MRTKYIEHEFRVQCMSLTKCKLTIELATITHEFQGDRSRRSFVVVDGEYDHARATAMCRYAGLKLVAPKEVS